MTAIGLGHITKRHLEGAQEEVSDKDLVTRAVDDIEHGHGDGAWNVVPGSWQNELAHLPQEQQFEQARQIIAKIESDRRSNPNLPEVSIDEGFNKDGKTVDNLLVKDGDHTKTINIKPIEQHIADAAGIVGAGKKAVEDAPDNLKKFQDNPWGIKDKMDN